MLIRPQQAHKSSMNASSACWKPRHWRQRSCPLSADRKRPQPEGQWRNGFLKKTRPSVICSFRICSFSWRAQGNRWWEEQIRDERLVEISTLLIHSAPKQKSNEWMHLSPFYTRMHGKWLRYARSTSQFHWHFLLKTEMIGASREIPLCHHDITRSDRQIGSLYYPCEKEVHLIWLNLHFKSQKNISNRSVQILNHII